MTDDELLAKLEETPPEEWSPEDLELLRARARESATVREALAGWIQFEQALTVELTRGRITAAQVLARIDGRRRNLLVPSRWWRAVAAVLLILGVGGVWYLRSADDDEPVEPVVRRPPPNVPAIEPPAPRPRPTTTPTGSPPPPVAVPTASPEPTPVAPVEGAADEPWVAMLAAAPRPFDDWCLAERVMSRDPSMQGRWWNTVSGQQRPANGDDRHAASMQGLFQLRAPWPAGAALTFQLREPSSDVLRLHLWQGEQGVSIEGRYRPYEQWTAYVARKRPKEPVPQTTNFAATDHDRARRTGTAPYDLRYHDGRIYLSRGDVLLLSVPMPGPPDAAYLEGHVVMRGIGMSPAVPLPDRWTRDDARDRYPSPLENPAIAAAKAIKGAEWKTELPTGAKFAKAGDEEVTLVAESTSKPAWASTAVPLPALCDLVFEVGAADPSTGIFLGDADGRPRHAVGFHQNESNDPTPAGTLLVGTGRWYDAQPKLRYDAKYQAPPRVQLPAKLRLVCGAGIVKVFASADGRTWGRIMEPIRGVDGPLTTLGVYCCPGKGARKITLSRVRATSLVGDPDVAEGAPVVTPPLASTGGLGQWYADVLARDGAARLPEHAENLLRRGTRGETARILLAGLAAESAEADGSDRSLRRPMFDFETASLVADTWDSSTADQWYDYFLRSVRDLEHEAVERRSTLTAARAPGPAANGDAANEGARAETVPAANGVAPKGEPAPPQPPGEVLAEVRRRWMEAPISTAGRLPPLPAELIRGTIFSLVREGRWETVQRVCRTWHYFGGRDDTADRRAPPREPIMALVDWAAAHAERRMPSRDDQLPIAPSTVMKPEWRHPLIEQFGKEGYNVLAELETALGEKAYVDACRIITSVTAAQAVGLLPNAADSELLVSLPGAVAIAMREHPELRGVMQREHGDLAQLRLRQATAEGDVDAVQALTTQFYGTSAAAKAQMWLGDRALAQGDAARAEGCYHAARADLSVDKGGQADELAPVDARLRLAAAMLGRGYGDPPAGPVTLGETKLSPAEFERTVEALRARAPQVEYGPRSTADADSDTATSPIPPPSRFKIKPWAKLEGDVGKNPEQPPLRDADCAGSQIAAVFAGDRLVVSNRFQVAVYKLDDPKVVWRTSLGSEQGRTYQWPWVAMPPIVTDDQVFVRRLTQTGPELACLDASDGHLLWRSPRGEIIASDPLVESDRVLAVTLTTPQTDVVEAGLVLFDRRTGKVVRRRSLMQLRDYWKRELPMRLISAGDMLLVCGGSCVVGTTLEGEPRWLRRLAWLPTSVYPEQTPERFTEITLRDGRLQVIEPWQARYSINPRTGSIRLESWGDGFVRPQSLAEATPTNRTVRHGNDSFMIGDVAFSIAGRKQWRLQALWSGETDGFATSRWPSPWQPTRPAVGPIVAHAGRYFAFTAADARTPQRDIIELVPGEPLVATAPELMPAAEIRPEWLTLVPEPLRRGGAPSLWTLLQSRYDEKLWSGTKLFTEDDAKLTYAANENPAIWTRDVSLPKLGPTKLRLRVAAATAEPWLLTVRVGEETVLEKKIEPGAGGASAWRDETADLAKFAGRDVQLTLVSSVTGKSNKPAVAAWQVMEVVE